MKPQSPCHPPTADGCKQTRHTVSTGCSFPPWVTPGKLAYASTALSCLVCLLQSVANKMISSIWLVPFGIITSTVPSTQPYFAADHGVNLFLQPSHLPDVLNIIRQNTTTLSWTISSALSKVIIRTPVFISEWCSISERSRAGCGVCDLDSSPPALHGSMLVESLGLQVCTHMPGWCQGSGMLDAPAGVNQERHLLLGRSVSVWYLTPVVWLLCFCMSKVISRTSVFIGTR